MEMKIQTQLYLRAIQRRNPVYRQGSNTGRQSKTDKQRKQTKQAGTRGKRVIQGTGQDIQNHENAQNCSATLKQDFAVREWMNMVYI